MKNLLLSLFIFISCHNAFGESYNIQSYYPTPFGNYEQIRLVPQADKSNSCAIGTIYVKSSDSTLLNICNDDGIGGTIWGNSNPTDTVWTQSGDNIFLIDTSTPIDKKVGIGTSSPEFKLTLDNDGGILAIGELGGTDTVNLTTSGTGTRFIWYPKKAALRAGEVNSDQWDDANISNHSIAFGKDNITTGNLSTISGGEGNSISSTHGIIGGGTSHTIDPSSDYSAIAGGISNFISGSYSFIGGGGNSVPTIENEIINSNISVIGGGRSNDVYSSTAPSTGSIVIGGNSNRINSSTYSIIAGDLRGSIYPRSDFSTLIAEGYTYIQSNSPYSTNLGTADLTGSYITAQDFGNLMPSISGTASTSMGYRCETSNDYTTIAGGSRNNATGLYSTIAGGSRNTVEGDYSFIGGGGPQSSIAENKVSGNYSAIGGGTENEITGISSFIGNGTKNNISGNYSSIGGGENNSVSGDYSWSGGKNMTASGNRTFVWGHDAATVDVTQNDAFIIYSGNVGINETSPSEKLHVNGDVQVDSGTIIITTPPTASNDPIQRNNTSGVIGKDFAETFETSQSVDIGDLLVIDETQNKKLKKSTIPYDKKIIGIVSGAPAIVFKDNEVNLSPQPFSFSNKTNPPVALAGTVLCKVSLENGSIAHGDLLTSSSIQGHAMKATDPSKAFNAIIGKALEEFNESSNKKNTGVIRILLTLQ